MGYCILIRCHSSGVVVCTTCVCTVSLSTTPTLQFSFPNTFRLFLFLNSHMQPTATFCPWTTQTTPLHGPERARPPSTAPSTPTKKSAPFPPPSDWPVRLTNMPARQRRMQGLDVPCCTANRIRQSRVPRAALAGPWSARRADGWMDGRTAPTSGVSGMRVCVWAVCGQDDDLTGCGLGLLMVGSLVAVLLCPTSAASEAPLLVGRCDQRSTGRSAGREAAFFSAVGARCL